METLVASAMGLLVLTATLTVGVQLQRKALFEQQSSLIQGGTQAVTEFFGPMLQRAGEGMGNARINLGGTSFAYAIQVTSRGPLHRVPELLTAAGRLRGPDLRLSPAPVG